MGATDGRFTADTAKEHGRKGGQRSAQRRQRKLTLADVERELGTLLRLCA